MTLVEIMIAMVVFGFLAVAITASVIQSQQIAQNNILRNTSYTIAQGYLEQIQSLPIADLQAAMDDPDGVPLSTLSVSAVDTGDIEVEDPLYLDGPDETLPGRSSGSNYREILIDLQELNNGDTKELFMDAWFDVEIEFLGLSTSSYAIEIHFATELRGRFASRSFGTLRGMRANINRVSR